MFITGALSTWSRVTEIEAYQSTGSGPVDTPPTVTLTGPAEGQIYTTPATIAFTANAADSDGTVKRVDFYANSTLVATSASSPYQATSATSAAGAYR